MVDENKFLKIFNIVKIVIIIVIVLCFILFFVYKYLNSYNQNKLENYLKEQGYAKEDSSWTKEVKSGKNEVSTTTYLYDAEINKFVKETKSNYDDYQEQIRIKYNGTDNFEVAYNYNSNDCMLVQSATYDYNNNEFKCNVDYNPNNCDVRCNLIKIESEAFSKELNEIMQNSGTNKSFLVKNKD